MPTPDPIAPERMEALMGGVVPEGEREALVQGLVRELRAEAPVAPAPLRERVRTLAEQPARPRRPAVPRRRTALALAFALVAVAGLSSAVILRGGGERGAVPPPTREPEVRSALESPEAAPVPAPAETRLQGRVQEQNLERAAQLSPGAAAPARPGHGRRPLDGGAPPRRGRALRRGR